MLTLLVLVGVVVVTVRYGGSRVVSGELRPFLVETKMEDRVVTTVGGVEGKEGNDVTLGGISVIVSSPSLFRWYSNM